MPTRQRGDSPAAQSYLSEVRAMQRAQRADKLPDRIPPATVQPLTSGGMHANVYTLEGRLTHAKECSGCFGRRDLRCRRCLELLRGSAPRTADYSPAADSRQRSLF